MRRHRLAEEPLCRHCTIEGRTVAASYVDHVDPHRGQWLLFFKYENTQSLCAHHHNMRKQQENLIAKASRDHLENSRVGR